MKKELKQIMEGLLNDYRIVLNNTKESNVLVGEIIDFKGTYKSLLSNNKQWLKELNKLNWRMVFKPNVIQLYNK